MATGRARVRAAGGRPGRHRGRGGAAARGHERRGRRGGSRICARRARRGAGRAVRGVHQPRGGDIVWIERASSGAVSLHVAPSYLGDALHRGLGAPRRSAVFTSATLAVAGSFAFALERFGLTDRGDARAFGSPFRYDEQAILVVPDEGALPSERRSLRDRADHHRVGRALDGRRRPVHRARLDARRRGAPGQLEESGSRC